MHGRTSLPPSPTGRAPSAGVQARAQAVFVTAVAVGASTPTALAHDTGNAGAGFVSGMLHPVSGFDHIAAMIAVGVWGAQLGRPALWVLPVAFPLVMAIGGFLGLIGVRLPGVEIGIALSAVALGIMVMTEAKPVLAVAIAMVAVFAVFHGHAHGTELPESQSAIVYSIGFVIATGILHLVGIGIGTIHRWDRGRIALRGLGGAILATGFVFLWNALT
ncbi:MAG: HupE/UreJ family protein [Phycisphaerales bacterium]|nr:HupE/UreJ family protein [Phycisphaerales bacterium]